MIILAFRLIEASVRRGDYSMGAVSTKGGSWGRKGSMPGLGVIRGLVLRLSERVGWVAIESLSKEIRDTSMLA